MAVEICLPSALIDGDVEVVCCIQWAKRVCPCKYKPYTARAHSLGMAMNFEVLQPCAVVEHVGSFRSLAIVFQMWAWNF